jgi:hypothetical protein
MGAWDVQVFDMEATPQAVRLGTWICPNPDCRLALFVVLDHQTGAVVASFPPEVIDFDTTNIPAAVQKALSEAITCHANECYIAAAIMVRKTLEELCEAQGATGWHHRRYTARFVDYGFPRMRARRRRWKIGHS